MKTILILFIVGCQAFLALAQGTTPYLTKSLSADDIKDVIVRTTEGNIMVSGSTGEDSRIEVYISENNKELTKGGIEKRLEEDYVLDISVSDHELHVIAKNKDNGNYDEDSNKQLHFSFKIFVPRNTNTDLVAIGGNIQLDNLSGQETFTSSGGNLNIDQLNGLIIGKTSGGNIEVSRSSDDISLKTSGGYIHAINCHGKLRFGTSGRSLKLDSLKGSIEAYTSGGSIFANNIEGELTTHTSGGNINLTKLSCSLEASISGGSMDIGFVQTKNYVKLHVNGGNIKLNLPLKQGFDLNLSANSINKPIVKDFSGEWKETYVNGRLNGGGIAVDLETNEIASLSFN